jgi:hypothetical protein
LNLVSLNLAGAGYKQAFAEEAVLLSSTTPGYEPGMIIKSSNYLNIPDGASITLLFQSGGIVRLAGPFDGKLQPLEEQPAETNAARLVELFRIRGVDASVVGGTRSVGHLQDATIDEVKIDPSRSGTYCVTPATSVWIMRPANDQRRFVLRRGGNSRTLAWPSEASRVEWPADLPLDDDAKFEVIMDGTSRATISFRTFPERPGGSLGQVAVGVLLGCRYQFDATLRRASLAVIEPELWLTTDHGRRPAYRIGDPVTVTAMASTDGYLYCVATGEEGKLAPIFPAGAVDGAKVHASTALTIPGSRQPVQLRAGPGLRQIKCWLADRDLVAELPHVLIAGPAYRLSDQLTPDLDQTFTRVGGVRIEKAALGIDMQ